MSAPQAEKARSTSHRNLPLPRSRGQFLAYSLFFSLAYLGALALFVLLFLTPDRLGWLQVFLALTNGVFTSFGLWQYDRLRNQTA